MDSRRFDKLTRALGDLERRQLLALLPATLASALAESETEAADKKTRKQRERKRLKKYNRRRKRRSRQYVAENTFTCPSSDNQVITCWQGQVCCDPERSNDSWCAGPGFTSCCKAPDSKAYGWQSDWRCCPSVYQGIWGACPDDFPLCCTNTCCVDNGGCSNSHTCMHLPAESASRYRMMPS